MATSYIAVVCDYVTILLLLQNCFLAHGQPQDWFYCQNVSEAPTFRALGSTETSETACSTLSSAINGLTDDCSPSHGHLFDACSVSVNQIFSIDGISSAISVRKQYAL